MTSAVPSAALRVVLKIVKAAVGFLVLAVVLLGLSSRFLLRGHRHSKQSECKANLKSAYTAQVVLMLEQDRYSAQAEEIGFQPERGNRYAYFLSDEGSVQSRLGPTVDETSRHTGIGRDSFEYGVASEIGREALPRFFAGGMRLGLTGDCAGWDASFRHDASPPCAVTMACIGQIDEDLTFDVWSVSTVQRWTSSGDEIPAGQPYCEVDDRER
jgi:hypothetical protein